MGEPKTHISTCTICEATCGIIVHTDGAQVTSIRGDADDPFSQGYICPKAAAMADLHHDPDRLKKPLRRTENGWEELSWDEAFDWVAKRLGEIRKNCGRDALAIYNGNPTIHNLDLLTWGQIFVRSLGCRRKFSATSADQLPAMLASLLMYGNQLRLPVPDVDRTDYFLILGANPLVSNGSLMTAPNMRARLRKIQERGGKVIVVDPRRSQTAAIADQHFFIRPGTDALLLAAMVHTMLAEDLVDMGRLGEFSQGLDLVADAVQEFSPATVSHRVGISEADILSMTRDFAAAPTAVCYGRMGTATQEFGGLCAWFISLLNILSGNLDRVGGMMFPKPAVDLPGLASRISAQGSFNRYRSRIRGLPEFGGELPVSTLAEEIESEGPGQIRALLTSAGNPVLSIPNGARLDRALKGLEFMVSIDPYLNETTRHADIILPPASPLQRDHYDLALNMLSVRNVAKFSPAVFSREGHERNDWEIFFELYIRLAPKQAMRKLGRFAAPIASVSERFLRATLRHLSPKRLLDIGLRAGPYGNKGRAGGLSLKSLQASPHGIDLGALEPQLPGVLDTESQTIELCPETYLGDIKRLHQHLLSVPDGGLVLIGRRQLRSNNSWLHNSQRLVKGKKRCTVLIHPNDAEKRGITEGAEVVVSSRVGEVRLPAQLSDEMMAGVVSIPHGWGHDRAGTRLQVAEAHAGVSINDICDEEFYDTLTGNAGFSGVPVSVSPLAHSDSA